MVYSSVSKLAVAALILCLMPISLNAKVGAFTGDDYFQHCTTNDPNWKPQNESEQEMAVYCIGYIEAAVTLIVVMDGRYFCLPTGATPQDVLKATVAFLQTHKDRGQQLLAGVMAEAVMEQWPCRSPSK